MCVYVYINKYTIQIYIYMYTQTHSCTYAITLCLTSLNVYFFVGLKRTLFSAEVEKQTNEKMSNLDLGKGNLHFKNALKEV